MMMTRAALFCVLMAAAASPARADERVQLTADEILAEIIGVTLKASRLGVTARVRYGEDGVSMFDAPFRSASGAWEIVGDEICVNWSDRDEVECVGLIRAGEARYKLTTGGPTLRVETPKPDAPTDAVSGDATIDAPAEEAPSDGG